MFLFYFFAIIIGVINLAVIELSKNTVSGWIIGIIATVAVIVFGKVVYSKNKEKTVAAAGFAVYIVVLAVNIMLTAPPTMRIQAFETKEPEVTDVIEIAQGKLTGVYNEDKTVKVYAGIPYAKAPVGELRFKEPQKPEEWSGVRCCDTFGPMAMQNRSSEFYDSLTHILGWHDYKVEFGDEYREEMSEDCLYLNVFAPAEESDELLPVIFYVHGGSLTTGQSYYSEYRGESLAEKGVIFVNFAYRLGALGYYAADDLKEESPNGTTGNYGLLDQAAALRWVYDNIENFGGDKTKITIAGESAGASSVNALCVSPLTEGLFRYAIAESSAINVKKPFHTFRSYEEAIAEGDKLRSEFNVTSSDELRSIPAEDLIKTNTQNSAMTLDGYAITEMPYLTYEKGENHEKALLNGFNAKEADAFLMDTKATAENYEELLAEGVGEYAADLAKVVPADTPQRDQHFIIDALGDAKGALNTAYSAMWFSYSHYVWNNYMVEQGKPAYEYYFTKTNNSLSNYHAGELPYAYGNLWRHPGLYDEEDYKLSEIMQNYWVNFAYYGDPNISVNGVEVPRWDKKEAGDNRVLELNTTVKMIEDPNVKIYEVIDKYEKEFR